MKKVWSLLAGITAMATTATAQIRFAPELGMNFANLHGKYDDAAGDRKKVDGTIKLGVKAGVNADIMLGKRFSIQPGLFYSIKGSKIKEDNLGISSEDNFTLHYFEIPVNFQYYFNDPNEGRLFIGVGPYAGIAFSGKDKYSYPTSEGTEKLKFGNDYPSNDLQRFELGGQVNLGYLLRSGLFFRAMYQGGITNLIPQGNQDVVAKEMDQTLRTTNITVSVGYMIGAKR